MGSHRTPPYICICIARFRAEEPTSDPMHTNKSGRGTATEPVAAQPRRILRPSIGGGVAEGTNPKGCRWFLYVKNPEGHSEIKAADSVPTYVSNQNARQKVVIPSQGTHPPHFQNFENAAASPCGRVRVTERPHTVEQLSRQFLAHPCFETWWRPRSRERSRRIHGTLLQGNLNFGNK